MIKIKVEKGNINKALKDYKSKVIKTKQMKKLSEQKEFIKPSVKNRKVRGKAIYVEKKKSGED